MHDTLTDVYLNGHGGVTHVGFTPVTPSLRLCAPPLPPPPRLLSARPVCRAAGFAFGISQRHFATAFRNGIPQRHSAGFAFGISQRHSAFGICKAKPSAFGG